MAKVASSFGVIVFMRMLVLCQNYSDFIEKCIGIVGRVTMRALEVFRKCRRHRISPSMPLWALLE